MQASVQSCSQMGVGAAEVVFYTMKKALGAVLSTHEITLSQERWFLINGRSPSQGNPGQPDS